MSNQVRIIGGKWKGRKLSFPPAPGLRPTLGRVRETLFNWLAASLPGARCLDLFAGSGALGLEALSRGAATVTFVERERRAAEALRKTLQRLPAEETQVFCRPAAAFLARSSDRWDIVFVDPPFGDPDLTREALATLRSGGHLAEGAVVYVEQPRRAVFDFEGYVVRKHRTAGDCQFGLLATC